MSKTILKKDIIIPRESGRKSQPLKVLNVGRVSREKGLDDLCKLQNMYDITVVEQQIFTSGVKLIGV